MQRTLSNMRLSQILYEDEDRDHPNPMKSIGADDPLFGDAFDAYDDLLYSKVDELELTDEYENASNRQRNNIILGIRATLSKRESIPFGKIIATEPYLEKAHLDRVIAGQGKQELPIVFNYNGKYIIVDGNHRAAAEFMQGKKSLNAEVIGE